MRNFVAKNAPRRNSGAHKDKKKEAMRSPESDAEINEYLAYLEELYEAESASESFSDQLPDEYWHSLNKD